MDNLKFALAQAAEYEQRINESGYYSLEEHVLVEDRAYKQAMLHAAIAQAEALTRLAEVAETMLEAGQLERAETMAAARGWKLEPDAQPQPGRE